MVYRWFIVFLLELLLLSNVLGVRCVEGRVFELGRVILIDVEDGVESGIDIFLNVSDILE